VSLPLSDKVLTKADIVAAVQNKLGLPRKIVTMMVNDLFDIMKDSLEHGDAVKVSGFGNFEVKEKRARRGRNPQSGEEITISARKVIGFKPSQVLRKALREAD